MFNYRVFALIKRELKERIMSKSFIISTLALPLFLGLIIGAQALMLKMESDTEMRLKIICESSELIPKLESSFNQQKWVKDGTYKLEYIKGNKAEFDELLKENKKDILDKKLAGMVFIPEAAFTNKQIELYAEGTKNMSVEGRLRGILDPILIKNYFKDKGVSAADLAFAQQRVKVNTFKVTKTDIEKESGANLALSYVFTMLLYISLLMMGTWIMQSVLEEKADRICEVVLSAVDSKELMIGKILGASFTGLLQMVIWLTPIYIIIAFSIAIPGIPAGLTFHLEPLLLVYYLINFLIGIITYVGLFATVGAIFNNAQEAQTGVFPLMMLVMIPFFITFSLINNPANMIALVSSMLPFASIMVMPARLTLGAVPVWQVALSFIVNIGTIMAIFPVAGKIYKVGILKTGKKPSFKEIIKWLKMS